MTCRCAPCGPAFSLKYSLVSLGMSTVILFPAVRRNIGSVAKILSGRRAGADVNRLEFTRRIAILRSIALALLGPGRPLGATAAHPIRRNFRQAIATGRRPDLRFDGAVDKKLQNRRNWTKSHDGVNSPEQVKGSTGAVLGESEVL